MDKVDKMDKMAGRWILGSTETEPGPSTRLFRWRSAIKTPRVVSRPQTARTISIQRVSYEERFYKPTSCLFLIFSFSGLRYQHWRSSCPSFPANGSLTRCVPRSHMITEFPSCILSSYPLQVGAWWLVCLVQRVCPPPSSCSSTSDLVSTELRPE